jgi:NAD(P)-dependent dehydrogenase (short-subunit alcohol dehydrogenase family)
MGCPDGVLRAPLSNGATIRHYVGQHGWFAGAGLYDLRDERRPQMQTERQPGPEPGPGRFDGLRVAITGGTSGLGLALVRELTRRGATVACVARSADRVGDVASKHDIHRIALQITGRLGGLDVLINNASDLGPVPLALLGDTECEDFERALQTNVLGPFRLTKALLGALAASAREGRGAVVLNISSDAAVQAYAQWGAYGASKAALAHMTRIWNEEAAAHGIRFLALDPGDMDTPMHELAVPGADRATLKQPAVAARELADAVADLLPARAPSLVRRAS